MHTSFIEFIVKKPKKLLLINLVRILYEEHFENFSKFTKVSPYILGYQAVIENFHRNNIVTFLRYKLNHCKVRLEW